MAGRIRLLAIGVVGGVVGGALLAVAFGAAVADGAQLGIALFTPALVLSTRPRPTSAADAVFVP